MLIHRNQSLKVYNTFGLDVLANYLIEIESTDDLDEVYHSNEFRPLPKLILGGGSNVLFTGNQRKAVLRIKIQGISIVKESNHHVWVKAGAGELWHQFVMWCIERGLAGVENLSLIPGTIGAAPMQNIGAYGVEQMEVFEELEAYEIKTGHLIKFKRDDCQFGYRHSIFKTDLKDKYIITSVTYKLSKRPVFNIKYGAIKETLDEMGVASLSIQAISQAVVHIRQSKLPDPAIIGNAGSFFKNPIIERPHYEALKAAYDDMPSYPVSDDWVKIPAAWLIEQSGWKGKKYGRVGVHDKQPLVLVNYGDGAGKDILVLAEKIQSSIQSKFGVELHREVNVY